MVAIVTSAIALTHCPFTALRRLGSYRRHTQIGLVWSSLDESFNGLFLTLMFISMYMKSNMGQNGGYAKGPQMLAIPPVV